MELPRKRDTLITIILLGMATVIAFLLFYLMPKENSANIAIIYVLALILISRYTKGVWYGLISALFCVVCINYLFTYPYFQLNFTLTGYPVTFLVLLAITLLTSVTTSMLTKQEEILKQRERELLEAEREGIRANLLRSVSHDFRTPLTGMLVVCEAYREHKHQYSEEEIAQSFQQISEEAKWLLRMVENLLAITQIHSHDQSIEKRLEPVEEIIEEVMLRIRKRFPDASIEVTMPPVFVMVEVEPVLMMQVLINLLENAILYSQSERPIRLSVSYEEKQVIFKVRDYGVGLCMQEIDGLLKGKLTRDSHQHSGNHRKGMGIGLSLCKTIMEVHGGSLQAENRENGAEFICMLPR